MSPRPRRWRRPAEWKSPESSASRSQSAVGATRASSRLTSSESDMLERQKAALVRRAEGAVPADTLRADDAVARDEDAEAVLRTERPCGAGGSGTAGERGELAVRDDVAARNRAQRTRELALERRQVVEIEIHVGEVDVGAREE